MLPQLTAKAEILITGKGNYTGEKIVQFVIEQKDIADCTVQPISASDLYRKGC